jgi:hypothetical protein
MSCGLVDLNDWRLYRDVERLHPLGSCVLYEFLNELGCAPLCRSEIGRMLTRYIIALCPREVRK